MKNIWSSQGPFSQEMIIDHHHDPAEELLSYKHEPRTDNQLPQIISIINWPEHLKIRPKEKKTTTDRSAGVPTWRNRPTWRSRTRPTRLGRVWRPPLREEPAAPEWPRCVWPSAAGRTRPETSARRGQVRQHSGPSSRPWSRLALLAWTRNWAALWRRTWARSPSAEKSRKAPVGEEAEGLFRYKQSMTGSIPKWGTIGGIDGHSLYWISIVAWEVRNSLIWRVFKVCRTKCQGQTRVHWPNKGLRRSNLLGKEYLI